MLLSIRYGAVVGCAVAPVGFWLGYGYHPQGIASLSPWLSVAAPVVLWWTVETAGRITPRLRWLGRLLTPAAVAGAGVWWWWLHGLLSWGHATGTTRWWLPTAIVLGFTATARLAGALLRRTPSTAAVDPTPDRELEPAAH